MKKFLTHSAIDRYILQRRHWMPYLRPYRTHPVSSITTPTYLKSPRPESSPTETQANSSIRNAACMVP